MLHSRNIDWGCYPQQGAGGRGQEAQRHHSPRRQTTYSGRSPEASVSSKRAGAGGAGGVARGWGKLWSYGEVLYITVSRSYGRSCLLDVVTVCHRWSGRGGLHTSCSLYNLPTIHSHCVVYISCVTVYSMYRLYGCTLSNSSSARLDIAYQLASASVPGQLLCAHSGCM